MTPQEQRKLRLANDYNSMINLRRDWLQWTVTSGAAPHVDGYRLDLAIKTIISPTPTYRDRQSVQIDLGPQYPFAAPSVKMINEPAPFHPNWYQSGGWCSGHFDSAEGLGDFVIRMIQTLQYNEYITNPTSPANQTARDWYVANKGKPWFPCDSTPLPDPTTARAANKKAFRLKG